MARKSNIARNLKRSSLVERYAKKRSDLRRKVRDLSLSLEKRLEAGALLQKMPRDSSPIRVRNRCALTGRPRGFYRRFGLAKSTLRDKAITGQIPGLVKASW